MLISIGGACVVIIVIEKFIPCQHRNEKQLDSKGISINDSLVPEKMSLTTV